jgi:flagellar hook assembly protein FlgD
MHVLYPNYPNPFNPETEIRFDLSGTHAQKIRLSIYNLLGQEIRTLVQGTFNPGSYRVQWDGKDNWGRSVSTGIYLYRLEGKDFSLTRRMALIK